MRWPLLFSLAPCDETFIPEAPFVIDSSAVIDAPADVVWDILDSPEAAQAWVPHIDCMVQLGSKRGVGAELDERFSFMRLKLKMVHSERGKRWSCYVARSSFPLATRMLEDITLETKDGKTHLRWRVYYAPPLLVRPLHPLARTFFTDFFRRATCNLARYSERT